MVHPTSLHSLPQDSQMTNEIDHVRDPLNRSTSETSPNLLDIMIADARPKGSGARPLTIPTPQSAPIRDGKPDAPMSMDASKPCPASPMYQSYIETFAEQMYDPKVLGDLNKLRNKYNCEIAQGGSPVDFARKVFAEDDDPYTAIFTPEQFGKMVETQKGKDVGSGVVLRIPSQAEEASGQPQRLIVQEFEATPGRTQRLEPGDEVLAVGNENLKGKSWREALKFFDGKENSEFDVKVLRNGKEQTVRLKRTSEELPAATSSMVDNDSFAHIRLRTFMQDDASAELEREVLAHPNAKGFILDLRHNSGGLLDQAFTSASVFMKEGDALTIRQRERSDPANPVYKNVTYRVSPTEIQKIQDGGNPVPYMARHADRVDKPVVVLTDQGTASAAEILAGALKDSDGAYVIGTQTYGKGIGQSVISDWTTGGALKMTTFHYFTPNGNWPGDGHHRRIGLKPDLFVASPAPQFYGTAQDGQLNAAIQFLRNKTAIDNTQPFKHN